MINSTEEDHHEEITPCYESLTDDATEEEKVKHELACIFADIDVNGDGKMYP